MTVIEVITLFGSGYVCGLSAISGFVFQALRRFNRQTWTTAKEIAWAAGACLNILLGCLVPILLIAIVVVGDGGLERSDFWPRILLFVVGVLAGVALVFFGVAQVYKGLDTRHLEEAPNNSSKRTRLPRAA
jgi:fatty acid desaturase